MTNILYKLTGGRHESEEEKLFLKQNKSKNEVF